MTARKWMWKLYLRGMKIILHILIFFFVFWGKWALANETHRIDSLRTQLEVVSGREKLDTFLELCDAYLESAPKRSIKLGHQAYALAENLGYLKGQSKALYYLGVAYTRDCKYDKGLGYLLQAKRDYESRNQRKELADCYYYLGVAYKELESYDKTLMYGTKSLSIYSDLNQWKGKAQSLNLLGIYYKTQGDYDESLECFLKSKSILEKNNLPKGIISVLNNIGNIYILKNDSSRAIKFYNEALSKISLSTSSQNRGLFEVNLGSLYVGLGDTAQAKKHLDNGLKIAQQLQSNRLFKHYYSNLSDYYRKKKDFDRALENYEKSVSYGDSILNNKLANQLSDLMVNNAMEKKNQENELLRKENRIQQLEINIQYIIGLLLLLVLSMIIWVLVGRYRTKKKDNELLYLKNRVVSKHQKELLDALKRLQESEEKLRDANHTKDKMFSVIAHDLRGSVGNIRSGLKLLLKDQDIVLSEEEKMEFMESLYDSANNSFELLENLLFWARNQSYTMNVDIESTPLNQLVEENVNFLSDLARIKGVCLFISSNEPVQVNVDRNMIQTVIRNLISNAIKFTRSGDTVEVNTKIMSNRVVVSIIDSGVGMTAQQISNLDKGNTTHGTAHEQGSGLGLMLCRDFLEKHHTKIEVESQVGRGSIFSFAIYTDLSELMAEDSFISSTNG